MAKFTISIFRYFKSHKIVFYLILLITTFTFAFFASKVTFEEDITTLLPSTEDGGAEKVVFSNLKVKDKIFILFNPVNEEVTPDELIEICDGFVWSLFEKDSTNHAINNILYNIDEDLFYNAISFLYENVPVFLDTSQYRNLDVLLEEKNILRQMEENYSTLRSPAGSAFKDMILQDPVALRNVFLSGMSNMGNGLGGNYTFYNNHIFSSDTSTVIAFMSPNFKSFDSKQGTELIEMIEKEIETFRLQNPDIEILYHGSPVQSVYNSRRIKQDLLLTISISLALIFIILLVCFRNKSTLLYLIIPVIYGVLFSLAVIYLIKGSMSLMALGIGAIVMGVAFSYCLHVITHYKYVNDPEIVLRDQTTPVFLGMLTTIGAFMGLLLTESELLRDFGLFASLGLFANTVFCLIFLPQFFNPEKNKKSDKAFAVIEKINSFPYEKQKWLIILIIIVSVVCFFVSDSVKFDSNLQNIGYHDKKVVHSQKLLSSKTNDNFATVYFSAVSTDLDSALIYSKDLAKVLDKLIEKEYIKGYSAPLSLFITENEQQKRIGYWNNYWTEEKIKDVKEKVEKAGAEFKFSPQAFTNFFNMLEADYEPVSLYDSGIIPEEIMENIIEFTDDKYMVFIPVQMNRKYLMEVGESVVSASPNFVVIDPMYYTNDMVRMIHDDFNLTLGISSVFVLIVLLISFKSIILALLAFMPMALSWYIVLGVMAMFGIEFNLINIVISSFIFGIGVDYSIFIMDGIIRKYRTKEPLLVYHKAAIFFSAVILIIVISSLLFAVHPAISSIGVATLIGMGSTIIISYSLQPFLFSVLISNRAEKRKPPVTIEYLFNFKKASLPKNRIKNNYSYKGNKIESSLKKELKETNDYFVIDQIVTDMKSLVDIGCGNGYIPYWVSFKNPDMKITGFDKDEHSIQIASNCYEKTEKMFFTTEVNFSENEFDVVVVEKIDEINEEYIINLIRQAKTVVFRKACEEKYLSYLKTSGYKEFVSDDTFVSYSRI
ncbi:MAG: MMPL family transporter [Bacteroidales bacterium]|nr:MMPL family transporter [Bacteroidales bacterium]